MVEGVLLGRAHGGYNDWVSLEMEDFTMSTEAGIQSSIDALQARISR